MRFFDLLARPGQALEFRAIRLGGAAVARHVVKTHEEAEEFAARHGRDAEIYVRVAPVGSPPNCLWVDVDFKDTAESLARVELALFDLDPTCVARSGGGLHLYWAVDGLRDAEAARPRLRWLASRLGGDMRSAEPARVLRWPGTMNHKYSPPRRVEVESWRPELTYEPWDFETENSNIVTREGYDGPTGGEAALLKARAWLDDIGPAVAGHGGDDHTFKVACMLVRDMGLAEEDAVSLMGHWNEACLPPWSDADLRKKIRGAMAYGTGEVGREDPAVDFGTHAGTSTPADNSRLALSLPDGKMGKLTKYYRACIDGGRLRVYYMEQDHVLGRSYWQSSSGRDFNEIVKCIEHMGVVPCGKNKKEEPTYHDAGAHWLECHKKKPTYRGLVYMPECRDEKTSDGRLNIWRGFAPDALGEPGSWELLKDLMRESLTANETASYEYIMNWMAWGVQNPHLPAGVAIVFRGPKGAGKSTLGSYFTRLFGRHGMQITSQTLLTGRFNLHLRDVSALFADEAFWAGDKAGEGVLKGLVTEKMIAYEGKGSNAEMGRNCVNIIMASNEHWVVPAGLDKERRFAVFEVEVDTHARAFWNQLHAEMQSGGGLSAMLAELCDRDLRGFDITAVPQTKALAEQKMYTLTTSEQWLVDLVLNDYSGLELHDGNTVLMDDLENSIENFYKHKRLKPSINQIRVHLGMLVTHMLPTARRVRVRLSDERRLYGYKLPHPEDAKKTLEKNFGLDFSRFNSDADEPLDTVEQGRTGWTNKISDFDNL